MFIHTIYLRWLFVPKNCYWSKVGYLKRGLVGMYAM